MPSIFLNGLFSLCIKGVFGGGGGGITTLPIYVVTKASRSSLEIKGKSVFSVVTGNFVSEFLLHE